ncbi:MAG: hypothetical protein ABIS67_01390, partial [Candidatus Eisenbacteria bacterium]
MATRKLASKAARKLARKLAPKPTRKSAKKSAPTSGNRSVAKSARHRDASFVAFVTEQLSGIRSMRAKSMF